MAIRACFFGDSFVNGVGDNQHLGWVGRLSAAESSRGADLTSYNLGIRRDTSGDVAARWQNEAVLRLRQEDEQLLVFSFGVNDAVIEQGQMRVELAKTIQNVRKILSAATQRAPCIFIGPPPVADQELNDRVAALSAEIRVQCMETDAAIFDPFPALIKSSIWMDGVIAGDGAHPNAEGYAELAGLIGSPLKTLAALSCLTFRQI